MVTTFSPPVRPKVQKKKKAKPPTSLIVLGVACAALLIAVFALLNKSTAASARVDTLTASAIEMAASVNAEGVTAEALADPATSEEALGALKTAVSASADNAKQAQAEIDKLQAEKAQVQTELDAAGESVADATSKASRATESARKSENELTALQLKYDRDVSALNKEIDALKAAAATETEAASEVAVEEEAAIEEPAGEETPVAEVVDETPSPEAVKGKPESSRYFRSYQYDADSQELSLYSLTGKKITFFEVPEGAYVSMTSAPVFDLFFRFKLMDVYESKPEAREYIIGLSE